MRSSGKKKQTVEVNFFLILTSFEGSGEGAENFLYSFSLLKSCSCGTEMINLEL